MASGKVESIPHGIASAVLLLADRSAYRRGRYIQIRYSRCCMKDAPSQRLQPSQQSGKLVARFRLTERQYP